MATSTKKTKELPANAFVHEILAEVSKQRTAAKKVELLQKYRNEGLVSVLT